MKCVFGCFKPATGIANLRGTGGSIDGITGSYPLCQFHIDLASGRVANEEWKNIAVDGWEPFPSDMTEAIQPPKKERTVVL